MDRNGVTIPLTSASPSASSNVCHAYADFDYQVPSIIVGVICFVTGIIYCFFGYRFFKAVLFLSGFLFGSVLIYLVCDREQLLPMLGNAGVAVGAGVLFGLVTMLVQYVGLFMSGFLTGLLMGVVVLLTWSSTSWTPPSTMWITVGVLFGVGLAFALMSLKWQRVMIILNTALVGGALLASALDYFADHFAILERSWEAINVKNIRWSSVCWYGWLILPLWPAFFALGSVAQWRWTSVGYNHKEGWRHFRRRRRTTETGSGGGARHRPSSEYPRSVVTHGRGSSYVTTTSRGPDMVGDVGGNGNSAGKGYEAKSWRSIYQSRRMHGDVICQRYLESLQRLSSKSEQPAPSTLPEHGAITDTPTFASDHTRLTVLTNESNKSGQSGNSDSDKLPS